MKKLISFVLSLVLVAGIFAIPGLTVKTDAAATVSVNASSSYYSYDSSTSTLTLKNGFNANQSPVTARGVYGPMIYSSGDLTINVQGTCYIIIQGDGLSSSISYATGILCLGNLHITGTGTLEIRCASSSYTNRYVAGIAALASTTSNINGGQTKLTIDGGVTVNVTLTAPSASRIYGVIANPDIYDGTLNISAGTAVSTVRALHTLHAFVRNTKSILKAVAAETTDSSNSSFAMGGTLNYYGGTVELMSGNYVLPDAPVFQKETLSYKAYVNTSASASTTQWNGSTPWNSYKYAKLETVIQSVSSPYAVTINKPMVHYTPTSGLSVTSDEPLKYAAAAGSWNTNVFYFGSNGEFQVTLTANDGYKFNSKLSDKLTLSGLGVAYTASVMSCSTSQVRFRVKFTIEDTRTVIDTVSITGFTMYRPKAGDEPLRNRSMGFTTYSEQKLSTWLVYNENASAWEATFDPFEAGKSYKAIISYRISDSSKANGHTLADDVLFTVDGYRWSPRGYVNQYSTYTDYSFESPSFTVNDNNTHYLALKTAAQSQRSKYKVTVFDRNNDDEYSMSKTVSSGTSATLTFSDLPVYGNLSMKVKIEKSNPDNTAEKYRTRITYINHSFIDYTYDMPEPYLSGDSDMDGDVDAADYGNAVNLALSSNGEISGTDMGYDSIYKQYLCDYDEDRVIDVLDCVYIERIAHS